MSQYAIKTCFIETDFKHNISAEQLYLQHRGEQKGKEKQPWIHVGREKKVYTQFVSKCQDASGKEVIFVKEQTLNHWS